jgi:hypothetical protein
VVSTSAIEQEGECSLGNLGHRIHDFALFGCPTNTGCAGIVVIDIVMNRLRMSYPLTSRSIERNQRNAE